MFSSIEEQKSIRGAAIVSRRTDAEISTYAYLDEFAAVLRKMAGVPAQEKKLRSAAALSLIKKTDKKSKEATWFEQSDAARMVACMAGKLKKERGLKALESLDADEKRAVAAGVGKLVLELQRIEKIIAG